MSEKEMFVYLRLSGRTRSDIQSPGRIAGPVLFPGRWFPFSVTWILAALSVAVSQPMEPGKEFLPSDLVDITGLDSTLQLDIRYARSDNFMGRPMYPEARAFLQRPAAEALVRVHRSLRESGYGLLIFDGYRPWSVTRRFWDETSPEKRKFVANPARGSRHNRGCAIDCSLFDLRTGEEVRMPSGYDEFSERASPSFAGGTSEERARRDLLRAAMEGEGFSVNSGEWWHFDYIGWEQYPVLDLTFEEIEAARKAAATSGNSEQP